MSWIHRLLHEQHETVDGDPVLFECAACGYRSQSLGSLHAHVEGHRGYTRLGIQIPFTKTAPADVERLMAYTRVVAVRDMECVTLNEVEL